MLFCEKCSYMFNITKDVKSKQIGGKINTALTVVFNKFNAGEPIEEKDLIKLTGKNIQEDERYDKLNKKDQKRLMSVIKGVDKNFFVEKPVDKGKTIGSNSAFLICKFCKNNRPIKPGTIIYSKTYNTSTIETEDYSYAIYDKTLVRTRNYICKNSKCETNADPTVEREAVITKNATDQVVYVCTVCGTDWVNAI